LEGIESEVSAFGIVSVRSWADVWFSGAVVVGLLSALDDFDFYAIDNHHGGAKGFECDRVDG
jgi:hypothetical protein